MPRTRRWGPVILQTVRFWRRWDLCRTSDPTCEPYKGKYMSTKGHYLAVFTSNKASPKWRAWYAMTEAEQKAVQDVGIPALKQWDEDHAADIVYQGGPLGPTKRTSESGITDVVNELTVFVVVRAPSHQAAAELFENHPHFTIFPCDAVEVMPLLGGE